MVDESSPASNPVWLCRNVRASAGAGLGGTCCQPEVPLTRGAFGLRVAGSALGLCSSLGLGGLGCGRVSHGGLVRSLRGGVRVARGRRRLGVALGVLVAILGLRGYGELLARPVGFLAAVRRLALGIGCDRRDQRGAG